MLIIKHCQECLTFFLFLFLFVDISIGFTNALYTVYENGSQAELDFIVVGLQRDTIFNFSTPNNSFIGKLLQYIDTVGHENGVRIKATLCINLVGVAIERDIALKVSTYNSDAMGNLCC